MVVKCFYCDDKATKMMVTNDWGNIPLCDRDKCFKKFNKENKSQFYVGKIE